MAQKIIHGVEVLERPGYLDGRCLPVRDIGEARDTHIPDQWQIGFIPTLALQEARGIEPRRLGGMIDRLCVRAASREAAIERTAAVAAAMKYGKIEIVEIVRPQTDADREFLRELVRRVWPPAAKTLF